MKEPGIKWELHPLEIPDFYNTPLCKIRGIAFVENQPILFTPATWAIYCKKKIVLTTKTDVYFLAHVLEMSLTDAADIILATACWDPKKVDTLKNKMLETINDAKNWSGSPNWRARR